ncbi:hypothetical protein [Paenibacillus sp. 22594]|uniref:hypothetical protein n=1 Tax=Paenibacillus sp. 22594 TaxID=3453947 RepID=UPI003F84F1E5
MVIEHKEYLFSGVGLIDQLNIKEQERAAQYWAALKLAASTIAVNVSEVRKSLFERPTAFQQKSPYLTDDVVVLLGVLR